MADTSGPPFSGVVSNSRTSAATPRGVGEAGVLAREDAAVALGVVAGAGLASTAGRARARTTWAAVSRMSSENCSGGSGLGRGLADGSGASATGSRARVGRTPDASVTREPLTMTRGDRDADADERVGTPPRGPGPAEDRGAGPGRVLGLLAQRLEQRPDVRGRDVTVHRELCRRGLQHPLGLGAGEADLAGQVAHADAGEVGQQQRLALGDRELAEGLEGGFGLLVEALVAVPDPRGVPSLRVRPGVRARPALGVGQPGDLRPPVPGDDERVADRAARGRQVAGQRVGLEQQPGSRSPCRTRQTRRACSSPVHGTGGPKRKHNGVGALFATFPGR